MSPCFHGFARSDPCAPHLQRGRLTRVFFVFALVVLLSGVAGWVHGFVASIRRRSPLDEALPLRVALRWLVQPGHAMRVEPAPSAFADPRLGRLVTLFESGRGGDVSLDVPGRAAKRALERSGLGPRLQQRRLHRGAERAREHLASRPWLPESYARGFVQGVLYEVAEGLLRDLWDLLERLRLQWERRGNDRRAALRLNRAQRRAMERGGPHPGRSEHAGVDPPPERHEPLLQRVHGLVCAPSAPPLALTG